MNEQQMQELQELLGRLNDEEKGYYSHLVTRLEAAEKEHNHCAEQYRASERNLVASQGALQSWLGYIQVTKSKVEV